MKTKTFFIILLVATFAFTAGSNSNEESAKQKAILSYALPSTLDWKQSSEDGLENDRQLFTLDDDDTIKMYSLQAGNQSLWGQFSTMSKDAIFEEMTSGRKIVHTLAGYKNWEASNALKKKSENEIVFELNGSYIKEGEKNFFFEKYYVTPYGFILVSLDWKDKSDDALSKKAQDELKKVAFKTEIK